MDERQQQKQNERNSPFQGLLPFRLKDENWFFGRDEEANEILSLILNHQLILIYGQSGAGKTSLLNAKIIPVLNKEGFHVLRTARVGPVISENSLSAPNNPFIFNASQDLIAGTSLESDSSLDLTKITLAELLKSLIEIERKEIGEENQKKDKVIIFDQLEELFTLYSQKRHDHQKEFFNEIAKVLNDKSLNKDISIIVIFVIREAYLGQLDSFKIVLPEKLRPRFRVEYLNKIQAKEAIEGPLKKAKDTIGSDPVIASSIDDLLEPQVKSNSGQYESKIDKIVNTLYIQEFVEPMHLQIVCEKVWTMINSSQQAVITQYIDNFGDADKELEQYYVESIRDITKEINDKEFAYGGKRYEAIVKAAYDVKSYVKHGRISEDRIREWFENKLITSNETRASVVRGHLSTDGIPNNMIDILERDKKLIRPEKRCNNLWYELTHDRLIKPIRKSNQERRFILARRKFRRNLGLISIAAFIIGIILVAIPFVIIPAFQNEPCTKTSETSDIQLPEGGFPDDTAINENTNMIYVIMHPDSQNGASIKVVDCTKYDGFKEPMVEKGASKLAINPKTNLIYVANSGSNSVSVIRDDASNTFLGLPLYVSNLKRSLPILPITTNLHIVKNVIVGKQPSGIAVNPTTNKIYVANTGSNTVSVIKDDDSNLHNTTNLKVGIKPNAIAVDRTTNKIYVANTGSNTVSVIDGNTNNVTNTNVEKAPFAISIDEKTKKVYVANKDSNSLSIIDGGDSKRYSVLNTTVGNAPIDIAVDDITDNDRSYIYVANQDSQTVSVIDGKTNDVIRTIPLKFSPRSISIDRQSGMLYINSLDLTVGGILEGRGKDVRAYPKYVQVGNDPQHLAVNPTTNKIYVANTGSNTVSVIDDNTNNVTRVIKLNGKQPSGIAVNPTTNKIYVANTGSNTVSVIKDDDSNLHNTTNLKVGIKPNAIAVDRTTNKIYVANTGSNTVSVIDGKTDNNSTIKTIPVGKTYVTDLAVNPSKNKIYVANTGSNTVSVIDGKTDKITNVGPLPFYIDESCTLTVYPERNMIYVVGSVPNQFSVIDGSTDNIVRRSENQGQTNNTNSLTGGPTIMAFNPKNDTIPEMYVANKYFGTIFFINKANNFPYSIAANEIRGSPSDIAFANKFIYVVNKDYNTITVIQPIVVRNK